MQVFDSDMIFMIEIPLGCFGYLSPQLKGLDDHSVSRVLGGDIVLIKF